MTIDKLFSKNNNKYLLAPSLLSADQAILGEEVVNVIASGADLIHFDVMDNHYVPNLTFGPSVAKAIKKYCERNNTNIIIDVHLMVEPVDDLISSFANVGVNMISFHPEASRHVDRSIELIKSKNCYAGVALNPATPLSVLDHVLNKLDFVLIMSVNPGYGGQKFIENSIVKIKRLKQIVEQNNLKLKIAVDGGVTKDNIRHIADNGAELFVAGSAIFNEPFKNYIQTINALRDQLS